VHEPIRTNALTPPPELRLVAHKSVCKDMRGNVCECVLTSLLNQCSSTSEFNVIYSRSQTTSTYKTIKSAQAQTPTSTPSLSHTQTNTHLVCTYITKHCTRVDTFIYTQTHSHSSHIHTRAQTHGHARAHPNTHMHTLTHIHTEFHIDTHTYPVSQLSRRMESC